MKMRYRWLSALLVMSLWMPAAAWAQTEQEAPLTRGEFFEMMTDQFGWTDHSGGTSVWSDVPDHFRYATSVRALEARGLLHGYPDGTLQLNQPISARDAAGLLVRTVGLTNDQLAFLFGYATPVDLGAGEITAKQAQLLINRVSRSDAESLSLLVKAEQATQRVADIAFTYTQSMTFKTAIEEAAISMKYDAVFDQDSGYKMSSEVQAPEAWPEHPYLQSLMWDLSEENFETYGVEDGLYYRFYEEDEEQWVRYDNWMTTEDYRAMMLGDEGVQNIISQQAYTYRYVGEQVCTDGQGQCQVVHFNWNPDYMGIISSLLDGTPFGWDLAYWLEEENRSSFPALYGAIEYDAASGLVHAVQADMIMQVSGEEEWAGEIATRIEAKFQYTDVAPIVLPAAAENAQYWGDDWWSDEDEDYWYDWDEEDYDWEYEEEL